VEDRIKVVWERPRKGVDWWLLQQLEMLLKRPYTKVYGKKSAGRKEALRPEYGTTAGRDSPGVAGGQKQQENASAAPISGKGKDQQPTQGTTKISKIGQELSKR